MRGPQSNPKGAVHKIREHEKLDKLDFTKLRILCIKIHYQESEKIIHKVGETFENYITSKDLEPRIYKEVIQLNTSEDNPV